MNKLTKLSLLLLLFGIAISSCKKEDETPGPKINIDTKDTTSSTSSCDTCQLTIITNPGKPSSYYTYSANKRLKTWKHDRWEIKDAEWIAKASGHSSVFNYTYVGVEILPKTMNYNWDDDGSIWPLGTVTYDAERKKEKTKRIYKYTNHKLTEIIYESNHRTDLGLERVNYTTITYDSKGNAKEMRYYDVYDWGKLKENVILASITKYHTYDEKCNPFNNLYLGDDEMGTAFSNTNNLLSFTSESYIEGKTDPTSTYSTAVLYDYNNFGLPTIQRNDKGVMVRAFTFGNCKF